MKAVFECVRYHYSTDAIDGTRRYTVEVESVEAALARLDDDGENWLISIDGRPAKEFFPEEPAPLVVPELPRDDDDIRF